MQILSDLRSNDESFFRSNGILDMLERNVGIKNCPERLQDSDLSDVDLFVTLEERVYVQIRWMQD